MTRGSLATALLLAMVSTARADLRFQQTTINVGELRSTVPLAKTFHFINNGPAPVTVTEIKPGCGCLRPKLERRAYGPGESGTLPVEINTVGQAAGPHCWYVSIVYTAGDVVREQQLIVTGTVITEVSVQPAALTLHAEGALSHDITLTDLRAEPLRIERVHSTTPHLMVQATPMARDALGHWTSRVRLRLSPDMPPGLHHEALVLQTSDATYRDIKIPVTIVKRAAQRVAANPTEVTLWDAPRLVRLRDTLNQPVVVESVKAADPAIVCSWAAGPDNQATVKLSLDRSKLAGRALESHVSIVIAAPVGMELSLPVRSPGD